MDPNPDSFSSLDSGPDSTAALDPDPYSIIPDPHPLIKPKYKADNLNRFTSFMTHVHMGYLFSLPSCKITYKSARRGMNPEIIKPL